MCLGKSKPACWRAGMGHLHCPRISLRLSTRHGQKAKLLRYTWKVSIPNCVTACASLGGQTLLAWYSAQDRPLQWQQPVPA